MHCCSGRDPAAPAAARVDVRDSGRRSWRRRVGAAIEWAVPIAALALIPKCPACVAGYVLLFTGVGLSFPEATTLRWVLIALSVAALGWLLLRAARRASVILKGPTGQPH
ncbi:hypothetical protein PHYC_00682 [Phycisphaerales bacterium]|nr:hypothetical protein PHYC_00682 [Phycisphaerales bacterium]